MCAGAGWAPAHAHGLARVLAKSNARTHTPPWHARARMNTQNLGPNHPTNSRAVGRGVPSDARPLCALPSHKPVHARRPALRCAAYMHIQWNIQRKEFLDCSFPTKCFPTLLLRGRNKTFKKSGTRNASSAMLRSIHAYTYMHAYKHTHPYIHTYIHTYKVHIHVYIYIYIYVAEEIREKNKSQEKRT